MANAILLRCPSIFCVTAALALVAAAATGTATADENSTISEASVKGVEMEEERGDDPKITRNVNCKKFFPSVGMTLTVPCDAETFTEPVTTETPPPAIDEDTAPITEVTPSIEKTPKARSKRSIAPKKRSRTTRRKGRRQARVGSCSGCRNSCYVRYRIRSHSRRFVPCMRRCWYQACR